MEGSHGRKGPKKQVKAFASANLFETLSVTTARSFDDIDHHWFGPLYLSEIFLPMHLLRALSTFVLVAAVLISGCTTASDSGNMSSVAPFGMDGSRLYTGTTVFDMVIVSGEEISPVGTATTNITAVDLDGTAALQLVLVQDLTMGTMYDTLFVNQSTLLPIRYRNEMGDMQIIDMRYGKNGKVVSTVTRGEMVTGIDTTITDPRLDAAEFSMLIPALPLELGYSAVIPTTHYELGAQHQALRVSREGVIDYQNGQRAVWIVEVENAQSKMRTFIDKENGMILQTVADLGPGRYFEQKAR